MKRIASFLITTTLCLLQSAYAATAVPDFISYQGRALTATGALMGTGTPVNRTVTFRVWDHATNSLTANLLYSEQQLVTIAEGEFSVLIGAGAATAGSPLGYSETSKGQPIVKISDVFNSATRYLGVTIDDGTAAVDNEITPRQQFVTSSYAMRAKVAEGVDSAAITTAMLANNAVTASQVSDAAITTNKLAASAVTATQIADATITTTKIAAGTITASNLATGAVTSTVILDGTIASADLANSAVTSAKIATGTITGSNLATGAVTSAAILDGAVVTAEIADSAVTAAKIADGTVTGTDIAAGTITANNLGSNTATTVENLRLVRGSVSSAGVLAQGSGFTSARTSTGKYTLTFSSAFTGIPTIVASTGNSTNVDNYDVVCIRDATASGCSVYISLRGTGAGVYFDEPFSFIAVGPR